MKSQTVLDHVLPAAIISLAYLTAFFITFSALIPIQNAVAPSFESFASLMFLPHGVRVIAAWLYGWRSIKFLAPGALITHFYLFGTEGFAFGQLSSAFFGIFCAALSFWLLSVAGVDFRQDQMRLTSWREIILAGSLASILNVFGTTLFYGHSLVATSAYLIGDIGGMIMALLAMMLIFRWIRRAASW
jgi:hypothetical protein